MVKEGDATVIAFMDAAEQLPESVRESVKTGLIWQNVPHPDDLSKWIVFAVFGVLPPEELGHWCGCVEYEYPNHTLVARLYHRHNMERERRVLVVWDDTCPEAGFMLAVDGFKTMKDFVRLFKDTWRTKSTKRVVN